jgi:hypothetical protein
MTTTMMAEGNEVVLFHSGKRRGEWHVPFMTGNLVSVLNLLSFLFYFWWMWTENVRLLDLKIHRRPLD